MPSSPLLLLPSGVWEGPSRLPLLTCQASLLCPQDQCSWGWGQQGALEGGGPAWELSRLPVPEWAEQSPSSPLPLLPEGPLCPASPVVPSASFLCPQGPTQPGWGFGGQWIGLGAQQAPRARVCQLVLDTKTSFSNYFQNSVSENIHDLLYHSPPKELP